MTEAEAKAKLISIRSFCFVRGVLSRSPDSDFLQAFRLMNKLYVDERRGAFKGQRSIRKPPAMRRRRAA